MPRAQNSLLITALLLSGCSSGKSPERNLTDSPPVITQLRDAYAAFNRGDMDAAVASLDPQIDWSEPAEFPGGGSRHGREAVKQYLTSSRAGWEGGSSDPTQFVVP